MAQNISIEYNDISNVSAREIIRVPDARSLTQIEGFLAAALPNIDAVVGAEITRVEITINYDFSGLTLKASPITGSRVSVGGTLSFLPGSGVPDTIHLPAVRDSFATGGALVVANELATFVGQATNGVDVGGTDVKLCDRANSEYDSLRRGKLTDRNRF